MIEEIRETGRNAQGVRVMHVDEDERVVAIESVGESRAGDALGDDEDSDAEAGDGDAGDSDGEPATSSEDDADDGAGEATTARDDGRDGSEPTPRVRRRATCQRACGEAHPDAHCELEHRSPFELIVATVLSAQSTDVAVNSVTAGSLRALARRRSAGQAEPAEVEKALKHRHVPPEDQEHHRAFEEAVRGHGGQVPQTLAELVELPGVGRKTANVVLGVAFGAPEGVVVDTHVQRITQRLGWTNHDQPSDIERT